VTSIRYMFLLLWALVTAILLNLYVESVGRALFLWFLGSVAAALRRAGELRLAAVAFASGTAAVALIAVGYAGAGRARV